MYNNPQLLEKWAPLLDYEGVDSIKDNHRRAVTAQLLENQERFLGEQRAFEGGFDLQEAPTNALQTGGKFSGTSGTDSGSPTAGFDPVLINLIRRSMPNLVAYDLAGVQPMNGPTGLIFAMRSRYERMDGTDLCSMRIPILHSPLSAKDMTPLRATTLAVLILAVASVSVPPYSVVPILVYSILTLVLATTALVKVSP